MPPFEATHVVRTAPLHLDGDPDRVFLLFQPEGERAWAVGWAPEHRWPADGTPREGAVFVTRDGAVETIWTVVSFAPESRRVVYSRVTPGVRAGTVEVSCSAAPRGGTAARVTYRFTALSTAGNEVLDQFTDTMFGEWMRDWEASINRVLHGG